MRRRKLKPYVLPTLMILAITSVIFGTAMLSNSLRKSNNDDYDTPISYVTSTILDEEQAVINETSTMINP